MFFLSHSSQMTFRSKDSTCNDFIRTQKIAHGNTALSIITLHKIYNTRFVDINVNRLYLGMRISDSFA